MTPGRLYALLALVLTLVAPRLASAGDPVRTRRLAVVVGANDAAPGRQALRYAQSDAQLMADVLIRVGRFAKADVQVLLEPRPGEILAALDTAARELQSAGPDSLLVFYYSGHSDGQQIFPHGETLSLVDLRDRIARSTAKVRVAILDTCRGGSWTRTKGLTVGPPLDSVDLMNVATEGTALLSSSSGLENAHEAGSVKGSFFTHHVAAGLLGAADKSGDGNITLQEVFEYAKERTVRDSARMAATTQHPSFDMQLRGRQDIVLAQVTSSPSALEVTQTNALEVIHLGSGITVLETPPGRQQLRLALVPGRYLVRRVVDGRVYSKEVEIRSGATVTLSEAQLELTGSEKLASKSDAVLQQYSDHSTLRRNWWELRVGAGVDTGQGGVFGSPPYYSATQLKRSFAAVFALNYGITDRLTVSVPLPALAYRFGEEGSFEVVPRGGLSQLGYAGGFNGILDAGVASRAWLTPNVSVLSNTTSNYAFGDDNQYFTDPKGRFSRLTHQMLDLHASAGLIWNIENRVTLAAGLGWAGRVRLSATGSDVPLEGPLPQAPTSSKLILGAVQTLGSRPVPLLQVHLSRRFSLDAYASWAVDLRQGGVLDRYLGGCTWAF